MVVENKKSKSVINSNHSKDGNLNNGKELSEELLSPILERV